MRSALIAALVLSLALAGAAVAIKKNPENNAALGPDDNAGFFLGYPTNTYQWHGCTRTSRAYIGQPLAQGAPPFTKGNKQGAVTFTVNRSAAPYFKWKAKDKYKICGVQATVQLSNPDVDSDLLAEAGYTSGRGKGSTAAGKETIKVHIPDKAINREQFKGYEGKTYSIVAIQDVTVFIKSKKKKRKKKR